MVLNLEDVEPGAQRGRGRLAGVQLGSETAGRSDVASVLPSVLSLCLLSPLLPHSLLLVGGTKFPSRATHCFTCWKFSTSKKCGVPTKIGKEIMERAVEGAVVNI